MERLTGLGGIFFKSPARPHCTVGSPFKDDTTYFAPSSARFMVNSRVDDLDRMRARLKAPGVTVDDKVEDPRQGRFGWVVDPDGTRIELGSPNRAPALNQVEHVTLWTSS